jgi:23S rRNA (uracil1939-C5)-methyltransferase
MKLACKYLSSCRGCPLGPLEFEDQKAAKKKKFSDRLNQTFSAQTLTRTDFDYVFPVFDGYRTRCDFIYTEGRLGWYDLEKKFLPIDECHLHTKPLVEFAKELLKVRWPVKQGSMRLRISPDGKAGVWLDLANLDIKYILADTKYLTPLFNTGVAVEMGQKGKRVISTEKGFKLSDPETYPWFQTLLKNNPVPLNALISSFTQTSPDLNISMIKILKSFLGQTSFKHVVEFGSGVGNFTLFLSEYTAAMSVIENDSRNLIPLKQNLEQYGLSETVTVFENINVFISNRPTVEKNSLYFVNPARSGVGRLFYSPIDANHVVYVSCHLESFLLDTVKLAAQGFRLANATLFDQFPHADHFEVLSYFIKD